MIFQLRKTVGVARLVSSNVYRCSDSAEGGEDLLFTILIRLRRIKAEKITRIEPRKSTKGFLIVDSKR
jgi:hypothetical protein